MDKANHSNKRRGDRMDFICATCNEIVKDPVWKGEGRRRSRACSRGHEVREAGTFVGGVLGDHRHVFLSAATSGSDRCVDADKYRRAVLDGTPVCRSGHGSNRRTNSVCSVGWGRGLLPEAGLEVAEAPGSSQKTICYTTGHRVWR